MLEEIPQCQVKTIAGISSLSFFSAEIGVVWEDSKICSAHGRSHNLVGEVQCHSKVFALTGGQSKAHTLCEQLTERGYGELKVTVGERLSYPDQKISTGSAEELSQREFADLSVMLIQNPNPFPEHGQFFSIPDSAFLRGEVPMTKEEIRTLALGKLHLRPEDTVWDVGAGTGSVAILDDGLLCKKGEVLPAHEFHYWDSEHPGNGFHGIKPQSERNWHCGHHSPTLYAGFPHCHLGGRPEVAQRFLSACGQYNNK